MATMMAIMIHGMAQDIIMAITTVIGQPTILGAAIIGAEAGVGVAAGEEVTMDIMVDTTADIMAAGIIIKKNLARIPYISDCAD